MYTIKQKNKTLSVSHNQKHYIIGFNNIITARKVHYNMHPEPKLVMIRDNKPINLMSKLDHSLTLEISSTLLIPKCHGDIWAPINDGMFHLLEMNEVEFYNLPLSKKLGIIVPYKLEEETNDDFMFKAYVLDPN